MSSTAASPGTWSRVTSAPVHAASSSVPPPPPLTAAQLGELESELRRELATLERRLAVERQSESAEMPVAAVGADASTHRTSDIDFRRDVVTAALARLTSGTFGTCTHCDEPIPFGRLLVMPEAIHCLACYGRT